MVELGDFNHGPRKTPMTETTMSLIELLQKHDEGDFRRAVTEAVCGTAWIRGRKRSGTRCARRAAS
jgi:hypothetical protein